MDSTTKEEQSKSSKNSFSEKLSHFLKFSSVSIICTLSEYVVFYFLTPALCNVMEKSLAEGLSTSICYILATIACFFLNKYVVFKTQGNVWKEAGKFFLIALPKMIITTFCVPLIIFLFGIEKNITKTFVNIIVQIVLFFLSYIFQNIWVFGKSKKREQTTDIR